MPKEKAHLPSSKPPWETTEQLKRTLAELREANERLVVASVRMQELAEEAQAARNAAEAASRAKDEFLAALSHELRTPLNAILGWTHLLRHGTMSGAQAEHAVEVIERNAKLQAQLITDLLDIAQIISGKLRLERELIDLRTVVDSSVESVRPAASDKAIALKCDVEADIQQVLVDPARVQQVIWNILSNAIKFTPPNGRIEVRLRQVGATAVLAIEDSGIRIEPEALPHIFDRFFQADRGTERAFGGLGLGLAIAKLLMDLHGGTVAAQSAGRGLGTTFTLTFSTCGPPATPAARGEGAHELAVLQGRRILLIEDESDARDFMTALLRRSGSSVTAVASVAEALAQWKIGAWDVLIADIGMPGQNGYDLIRQIRALEASAIAASVPAIALTAYARPEDRDKALSAGFTVHVSKPFEPDSFLRTVAGLAPQQAPANRV